MLSSSRTEFCQLAQRGNLIPVYREIIADLETPVSAFLKIDPGENSFLLESAEHGGKFSRYSFIGANPRIIFTVREGKATLQEKGATRTWDGVTDPLSELQKLMACYQPVELEGLPIFYGGAVGYLSYEAVTYFEKTVPRAKQDDLQIPDACFLITDTLLIFDHEERRIKILANVFVEGDAGAAYDAALQKIEALMDQLQRGIPHSILSARTQAKDLQPAVNLTQDQYVRMTEDMQEYIRAGDIFQVVPSQRFSVPFDRDPIDLYRALRLINPSPYMFCLKLKGLTLVGSSPETHVRCELGRVAIRPIAGTRPRCDDPDQDDLMADELINDPKERAEHVMLVDLARNDVGRVCEFTSVCVTDFMKIERYSHVMHIVSNVVGQLKPGYSSYDVMRATFPAGTVSGSPKIRAMQIIAEKEPTVRGSYAGAVGYFGFSGNLDSCIAIRTVLIRNGQAYLQAGGGLVADSTPLGEYNESVNKAKAGLKALALAQTFKKN
jgi:anthranilate synthase component 1